MPWEGMLERGRPPKYETPKDLEVAASAYFTSLEEGEFPTLSGLAYHLGFQDRHSLYDYEAKPEYTATIKRARLAIERLYEGQLINGKANTAGVIFWLKNQGWTDKQTVEDVTEHKPTTVKIEWVGDDS